MSAAVSNIYLVINWTRKRHFVAVSKETGEGLIEKLRAFPQEGLAGWDLDGDEVSVQRVAEGVPDGDAPLFLENFLRETDLPGWESGGSAAAS